LVRRRRGACAAGLALVLLHFLLPEVMPGRGVAIESAAFSLALLLSWRLSVSASNVVARGDERVLVLGTGEAGISLVQHIIAHPEFNIKVVGFLDEKGENIGVSLVNPCIIGATAEVEEIAAREKIDRGVLSFKDRLGSSRE